MFLQCGLLALTLGLILVQDPVVGCVESVETSEETFNFCTVAKAKDQIDFLKAGGGMGGWMSGVNKGQYFMITYHEMEAKASRMDLAYQHLPPPPPSSPPLPLPLWGRPPPPPVK